MDIPIIHNGEMVSAPRNAKSKIWTRIGLGLIATGAILGAMVLASPPAKADSQSYLASMADAGYTGPTHQLLALGRIVCNLQDQGYDHRAIALGIVANTGAGIYSDDAYEIMVIANRELCNSTTLA